MSNKKLYDFYVNKQLSGKCSIEELIRGINDPSSKIDLATWVRAEDDIHWKFASYHYDFLPQLTWEYITPSGHRESVSGSDLQELFACSHISYNTHVRILGREGWKKFKNSALFDLNKAKKPQYYGFHARIPNYKIFLARGIDLVIFSLVPTVLVGFISKYLFLFFLLEELFLSLILSLFQALCISCFRKTIGLFLTGLSVTHANGKNLSFPKAFFRQLTINFDRFKKRSISARDRSHYTPWGAIPWDVQNHTIIR